MCFLIFFLYFANGCTRNELNNTCDPSSDGFTKSLFVKAVSKDKSPQCGINYFSNSGNNGSGVVNIPDAPTGVGVAGGDTKSTVSWSNVSGATSYNIYWSTTAGVTVTTGTKIPNVSSSPYDHLGLINITKYYYIVTAVNSAGESTASAEVSAVAHIPCTTNCKIFATADNTIQANIDANSDGDFVSEADAFCQADPSVVPGTYYKALLVGNKPDGTPLRQACATNACVGSGAAENIDWVFRPNTNYYRPDSTQIGTTTSAGLLTLTASMTAAASFYWTGIGPGWVIITTGFLCTNWTLNTAVPQGIKGVGTNASFLAVASGSNPCNTPSSLLCVEQ